MFGLTVAYPSRPICSENAEWNGVKVVCARRIVLLSSDELRDRDSLVHLFSERGVAVALEYLARFEIEMETALRYHIERDVGFVV